jgi:Na+/H+ antiporter NhaA
MSIFITLLAFDNEEMKVGSKLAVLFSSFIAGLLGYAYLSAVYRRDHRDSKNA